MRRLRNFLTTIIFLTAFLILSTVYAFAQVEPNVEVHKIIGKLYAIAAVRGLEGNATADENALTTKYFASKPEFKFARVNNNLWVGVPVDKRSTARKYLRANSQALGICDKPDGAAWIGEDYAWLNINKVLPGLKAAQGSGKDSDKLFFTVETRNNDSWWLAEPAVNKNYFQTILKKYHADNVPVLNSPKGLKAQSIYDQVRPASVDVPEKIHMGNARKGSYDMEIGDVIFSPVPNVRY